MAGVSPATSLNVFLYAIVISSSSATYREMSDFRVINWGLPLAGHKLKVRPLNMGTARNLFDCMSQCTKTEECISINLGPRVGEEHVCEELKQDRHRLFKNMTIQPGWTYVGLKVKYLIAEMLYEITKSQHLLLSVRESHVISKISGFLNDVNSKLSTNHFQHLLKRLLVKRRAIYVFNYVLIINFFAHF